MLYTELKQINTKRENLRWNAWGSLDSDFFYADKIGSLLTYVRHRLHLAEAITPSLRITDLRLPETRIKGANLSALQKIVGKNRVKNDLRERVLHSAGKSYYDVLRIRSNLLKSYTDAVVYPETENEIAKILKLAAQRDWAVIPFGGGSSVVGGVEAKAAGKKAILTIDITRMNRLINVNSVNQTATFEAGIYGPDLETALGKHGYTLGHFPQSFEYSTLGGWVAARSAGQQSNRYGKIEDVIAALRMVTPRGLFETAHFPAGATGPDLNQVICGSEGTLGIITSVTVKIHPLPAERHYCGFLFPSFKAGLDFIRYANQTEFTFSTLRLSDEEETNQLQSFSRIINHKPDASLIARSKKFVKSSVENIVLQANGLAGPKCIVVAGSDGEHSRAAIGALKKAAPQFKGMFAGTSIGKNWLKGRFNMPFLRNYLLEYGLGVDTMETAVPYDKCMEVHRAVLETMEKQMPNSLRMCHASHSYHDGACLYFTIMFPIDSHAPVDQWLRLKNAVSDAILAHGGNISHHHGVGADHREHFKRQVGPVAWETLTALKKSLDPRGSLNPSKLMA